MTSYVMAELKIAIYSQNSPKNQKNSKKVLNIGISSGFLHIMKGNGNSSMSCEFELHSMRIFFKMTIFCFKKLIWVPSTPPHLPSLTAYPTPTLGGTPNFFHQNERKGCKIDYLKARGQLLLRFYAAVKKLEGGQPPWLDEG